jgi:hypothetical protein
MTYQEELRRYINSLEEWHIKAYGLKSKTDLQTKKNITKWINELLPVFYGGAVRLNSTLSYQKVNSVYKIIGKSITPTDFIDAFYNDVKRLSTADYRRATVLQRGLATKFGKNYEKFYQQFGEVVTNYPSKPLREVVRIFERKAVSKNIQFVDKSGRTWKPETYASMYGRTRSAEVSTTLERELMNGLGMDIVHISNANTITPICTLFEDKYFSLSGKTKGLPKLEVHPPFHPNCMHIEMAVDPRYIEKYKAHNRAKDKEIAVKKSQWTEAERRAVAKQMEYLKSV